MVFVCYKELLGGSSGQNGQETIFVEFLKPKARNAIGGLLKSKLLWQVED